MNTKLGVLFATGLLALSALAVFAPSASAHNCTSSDDSCNQPCDDDGKIHHHRWVDSNGNNQFCDSTPNATIAGPASLDVKGVLGVGVGFCQNNGEVEDLPLDCDNGPGSISGAGAYVHDTTGCTALIGCIYVVSAEQVGGVEVSGWGVSPCTDRNSDGVTNSCSNVPNDVGDDFGDGYKGEEVTGASKETKDPAFAQTEFCVRPDVSTSVNAFSYDDFFVFVTAWADEDQVFTNSSNDNTGTGAGLGLFDVYAAFNRDATSHDDCADTHTIHSTFEDPNH